MLRRGISFRVTQGLRSWAEQAALFAHGRTAPGPVVTKAPPGHSYHNFGLAVDVAPFNLDMTINWNTSHPAWKRMVECGVEQGLESGTKWRTFPDYPHFQWTGRFPVSPDDEVRSLFQQAGMESVWKEMEV